MASRQGVLFTLSLVFHGGLAVVASGIEVKSSHAATAIELAEVKKKAAPPAKVEQKPPPEKPKPLARKAAPQPLPEAEPVAEAPLAALPDFGLSLSGGVSGGGIALPPSGQAAAPTQTAARAAGPVVKKRLVAEPSVAAAGCDEAPTKPRPVNVPQPSYTEAARAASVEGKVRLELTVDESGRVVEVRVLQGLGYGLDDAALAAARGATFEPALQCGKPTRATFTMAIRFNAS